MPRDEVTITLYNVCVVLPALPEDGRPVEDVEDEEEDGEHAQEDEVRLGELVRPEHERHYLFLFQYSFTHLASMFRVYPHS